MITNTTIFTGGDSKYWKQYGKSFVKSIKHFNPDTEVFIQVFNPDSDDIAELDSLDCKYTIENIEQSYIDDLVNAHIDVYTNNTNPQLKAHLKTT